MNKCSIFLTREISRVLTTVRCGYKPTVTDPYTGDRYCTRHWREVEQDRVIAKKPPVAAELVFNPPPPSVKHLPEYAAILETVKRWPNGKPMEMTADLKYATLALNAGYERGEVVNVLRQVSFRIQKVPDPFKEAARIVDSSVQFIAQKKMQAIEAPS